MNFIRYGTRFRVSKGVLTIYLQHPALQGFYLVSKSSESLLIKIEIMLKHHYILIVYTPVHVCILIFLAQYSLVTFSNNYSYTIFFNKNPMFDLKLFWVQIIVEHNIFKLCKLYTLYPMGAFKYQLMLFYQFLSPHPPG